MLTGSHNTGLRCLGSWRERGSPLHRPGRGWLYTSANSRTTPIGCTRDSRQSAYCLTLPNAST